jgi:hypothetical protein
VYAELAKEGVPLPFGNRFWASNWPTGKSPLPGLIIHLIPSVSLSALLRWLHQFEEICLSQVIIIIAPPPAVVYPFILDVEGYPQQIINFFIVVVRTQFQLLLLFSIPTAVTAGPILVAIQETQCHPTIQGQVCRITPFSCPRLTTLFNLQSGGQLRSSSWRRPYSVSSATSRPHNLPDLIFSLNHSIGCAIPPPCQSRR